MARDMKPCCANSCATTDFVGRRAELSQLERDAGAAASGNSWVVLIEGSRGVGKTALLRRAMTGLWDSCVLHASCDPSEADKPFGLVSQLLWRACCHAHPSVASAVRITPEASPAHVGAQILELVDAAQAERPLAVVIDDLQCADPASTQALGFVLRRLGPARVLTLLSARTETPTAAVWSTGPVDDLRRLTDDHEFGRRITLRGLTTAEVEELAHRLGHGPIPLAAAERLRAHTDGNPAYLRGLLTDLPPESLASADHALPVPPAIAAQVGRLLSALPEADMRLLAAIAVLDAKYPLGLAAQVARVSDPVAALESLLDAGIVQWWPEDPATPVRIRLPILRDAIYQLLTPGRRRELHLAAASLVDGGAAWVHRVAAAGGPDQRLARELDQAADAYLGNGDAERAATLLLWAADLSDDRPEYERRLLAAAAHLVWCHRFSRLAALGGKVAECAPCPLRDLILVALNPAEEPPASVRASLTTAQAVAVAGGTSPALARTALAIARGQAWRDTDGSGGGIAEQVLAIDDLDPQAAQLARCLVAELAGRRGGTHAALRAVGDLVPVPSSAAFTAADAIPLWRRGALRAATGQLAGAAEDLSAALQFAGAGAFGDADASASALLAYVQYLLGAWTAAAGTAGQAISMAVSRGATCAYSQGYAVAACVAASAGGWERAEECLGASKQWWRAAGPSSGPLYPALAEATLAQARGDHARILAALGPLLDQPQPGRDRLHQFWWRPLQVEALIAVGRLNEAASALAIVAALAKNAAWLRIGYGWLSGWLADRLGDAQKARSTYEEALAAPVTAEEVPLLRARLEQAYGQLLLAERSRRPAITWLRRAHERYTALGASPFVERCTADLTACGLRGADPGMAEQPAMLSGREHRVAHLVAQGLTNHEVAKELYISTKTVEYHLSNIFIKLGITSRRQLRSPLHGGGVTQEFVPRATQLVGSARAF
jgi:ATP/maltotriose-dependent transcriptional regulator MalT